MVHKLKPVIHLYSTAMIYVTLNLFLNIKSIYTFVSHRYVLTDYLLTPTKVEYTEDDVAFNKWHRKTRSLVERVIGNIKQRWRYVIH